MKRNIVLITGFTLIFDQIIKFIVSNNLVNLTVIPNFLSFIYAENKGAAFSILSGNTLLITLVSIILFMFLINMAKKEYSLKKKNSLFKDFTYGLLFGGILGNLVDRIIRGVVVDYVSIKIFNYYFPIFNLADVAITIGVIFLLILTFKDEKKA